MSSPLPTEAIGYVTVGLFLSLLSLGWVSSTRPVMDGRTVSIATVAVPVRYNTAVWEVTILPGIDTRRARPPNPSKGAPRRAFVFLSTPQAQSLQLQLEGAPTFFWAAAPLPWGSGGGEPRIMGRQKIRANEEYRIVHFTHGESNVGFCTTRCRRRSI